MEQGAVDLAYVIAGIAHDLRTPLNTINGFSRLLLNGVDGPLSEMQATDVQAIHTSGGEMLRMVDCLIDLAKVQAGQLIPSPSAVYLDALLEKIVALQTGAGAQDGPQITYSGVDLPQPLWLDGALLHKGLERLLAAMTCLVATGTIKVDAQMEGESATVQVDGVGACAGSAQALRALRAYSRVSEPSGQRLDTAALYLITAWQLLTLQGATVEVSTPSPTQVCVRAFLPLIRLRTGPELDP